MRYTIRFTFIEFGHECHTSWGGAASSREDAVRKAYDWFGFDKDNIEVVKTEFLDENGEWVAI